jgi:hypothetical protein
MSPKRTTAPPTHKHSRSSSSGQRALIAKEKTNSNQQRREPPLTIAFIERFRFSRGGLHPLAANSGRQLAATKRSPAGAICKLPDAVQILFGQGS